MAAVLAAAALPTLVGCDSTFEQNARAKLAAQREIASRTAQEVTQRTPDVRVSAVTLLRDRTSTAVVVEVRSEAAKPLNDLPITVGVRRGARKVVLNDSSDLEWFQRHIPVIAAGGTATWVFRSPPGSQARDGDEPFVRIGAPVDPPLTTVPAIPQLRVVLAPDGDAPLPTSPDESIEPDRPPAAGAVRVSVQNESDVPQLRLPVTVIARDGTRVVAAGVSTLEQLPTGDQQTIDVPLTRESKGGTLQALAIPTIFD